MFKSVEHAISTAYFMLSVPIEGKNSTQVVIENLRERFDPEYLRKPLSELTPHEWHAQAVMTIKLFERTVGNTIGFHILRCENATGSEVAESLLKLEKFINPNCSSGTESLMTKAIIAHVLRRKPSIREISDKFDIPKSYIHRTASAYSVLLSSYKRVAIERLEKNMQNNGIICKCIYSIC